MTFFTTEGCVAAVGFAGGTLFVSVLFGKFAKRTKAKDAAYECGKDPIGEGSSRFSVKFYLVAMLFILFDIEVVFMYPWAVVYRDMLAEHATRNLIHYGAQIGWFFALTLIPIGQVVAIEFTMPIWTAILAASFLGERMTVWKILAIVLGVVGVIIIVRPAAGEINLGQVIALAAAVGFGISVALMKSLTRTETAVAIVFWMLAIQTVAGFFPSLYVWKWPSQYAWWCAVVIAFSGTFSHICMARAMLYADATVILPMDFLRVPLTAAAGWLNLFGTAGWFYRAWRGAHPDRQSPEPETSRLGAGAGWNLTAACGFWVLGFAKI